MDGDGIDRLRPALPRALRSQGLAGRQRFILLMLAPATLLLVGLTVVPFVVSIGFSLTDYSLTKPNAIAFIGLRNYLTLLTSEEFWNALRVTALFTVLAVAIQLVVGVGVAAMLQYETRAVPILRLIYLLPLAITPVAAVFTFRIMFSPTLGVFNYLLRLAGLPRQDWLGTPGMALLSLLMVDTWQWAPFILLIAAAGLAAMDEEPLEAAKVDGAGPFAIFFHLALPMLFPYLAVAIVFRAIDAFKTFDIIFVLTGGGPGIATRTLNLLAYKNGIEFLSMGYAAALTIIMLVLTIVASQSFLRRVALFRPKATL
jgi:multiple sugar transport system permease protein